MSKVQTLSSDVQRSQSESHWGKALQSHGDSGAQSSSNLYRRSCHVYVLWWSCGAVAQYRAHDVIGLWPDWSLRGPLRVTSRACVCSASVMRLPGCLRAAAKLQNSPLTLEIHCHFFHLHSLYDRSFACVVCTAHQNQKHFYLRVGLTPTKVLVQMVLTEQRQRSTSYTKYTKYTVQYEST